MYNKRLLLLGITIIGSGWMYPDRANVSVTSKGAITLPRLAGDTERIAATSLTAATVANSNAQDVLSKELFMATTVGGSNGVRLNPKALSFVQDYVRDNWDELQNVRSYGQPYFSLIENILTQYGLPRELKYLAVIESNLKSSAVSRVGAKGPWQLMPQTARELGLKVNHNVDERKNYSKSTRAAALYLRDLYKELGDWLLVIAAYNGGPGTVLKAISRSGSHNFWALQNYLPMESRAHVKRFIGAHYYFEGGGSLVTLTKSETAAYNKAMSLYLEKLEDMEENTQVTASMAR